MQTSMRTIAQNHICNLWFECLFWRRLNRSATIAKATVISFMIHVGDHFLFLVIEQFSWIFSCRSCLAVMGTCHANDRSGSPGPPTVLQPIGQRWLWFVVDAQYAQSWLGIIRTGSLPVNVRFCFMTNQFKRWKPMERVICAICIVQYHANNARRRFSGSACEQTRPG